MNKEQFNQKKREIAEAVVAYLHNPDNNKPCRISQSECALLMSVDENHIIPMTHINKIERDSLKILGTMLRSQGITKVMDIS